MYSGLFEQFYLNIFIYIFYHSDIFMFYNDLRDRAHPLIILLIFIN